MLQVNDVGLLYDCWLFVVHFQLVTLFTEETDRMKDITHLRSFAYDFYLREVQYFLSGRTSGLGPEYHLTGFLHDFIEHFFTEPVFARNIIHEGEAYNRFWFVFLEFTPSLNSLIKSKNSTHN